MVPSSNLFGKLKGFPLLVVLMIVPPLTWIPPTSACVKGTISMGSRIMPLKASIEPYTSQFPFNSADLTMARITAFKPGQSPPPVSTNNFFLDIIPRELQDKHLPLSMH